MLLGYYLTCPINAFQLMQNDLLKHCHVPIAGTNIKVKNITTKFGQEYFKTNQEDRLH